MLNTRVVPKFVLARFGAGETNDYGSLPHKIGKTHLDNFVIFGFLFIFLVSEKSNNL